MKNSFTLALNGHVVLLNITTLCVCIISFTYDSTVCSTLRGFKSLLLSSLQKKNFKKHLHNIFVLSFIILCLRQFFIAFLPETPSIFFSRPSLFAFDVSSKPPRCCPLMNTFGTVVCFVISMRWFLISSPFSLKKFFFKDWNEKF